MAKLLITIPYANVDENLTDFPVLATFDSSVLSASALATLIAGPLKVSFTDALGDECYAEIEYSTSEEIRYHVKVPSVSSSEDTEIIFEYGLSLDNTDFIGVTGSTVATNVWDSNYAAVYHLSQDPSGGTDALLDSTGNIDLTPDSTYTSSDLILSDDYGYGINSDSSNVSCLGSAHDLSSLESGFTIETLHYTPARHVAYSRIIDIGNSSTGSLVHGPFTTSTSTSAPMGLTVWNDNGYTAQTVGIQSFDFLALYFDNGSLYGIINSVLDANSNAVGIADLSAAVLSLFIAGSGQKIEAVTYEIRVSSTVRSKAWIDATEKGLRKNLCVITGIASLSGTVEDTQGTKLPGATVNVFENDAFVASTVSDSLGEWEIENLPSGTFNVVGELESYKSDIVNDVTSVEPT